MFNIKVNILHTMGRSVVAVSPTSGSCQYTVNVGLILEQHYVGLDIPSDVASNEHDNNPSNQPNNESLNDNDNSSDNIDPNNVNDPGLDDDAIAEGDEHMCQITGSPQPCSMLTLENPELEGQEYSVAPAEGLKPMNNDGREI